MSESSADGRRAAEQWLPEMVEAMEDAVSLWECSTWQPLYVNASFCRFWAISWSELFLKPQSLLERLHPDDQAHLVALTQALFQEVMPHQDLEFRLLKPDGTWDWAWCRAQQILSVEGIPVRVLFTSRHLPSQRSVKDSESQNQLRDQFLSVISHEMRTPMNSVANLSRLLERSVSEHDAELLRALRFTSDHLLKLLNDFLDYSRMEAGKLSIEMIAFHLPELLKDLHHSLYDQAYSKGVELQLQLAPDLPIWVEGDPYRLSQILFNLLSNALRFTQQGQVSLRVLCTSQPAYIRFEVTDTGIGIEAEQLALIFEPYTQATSDISRRFGGTGLGLHITRRLLNLLNSDIQVSSQPGRGSCFGFELELNPLPEYSLPTGEEDWKEFSPLRGLKLLLVEDDPMNQWLTAQFLKHWQVEFQVAVSGQEAIEYWENNAYDLMLLDLHLGDLSGQQVLQHLRQHPSQRAVPAVIGVSGLSFYELRARSRELQLQDFLPKPYEPIELYGKLKLISLLKE